MEAAPLILKLAQEAQLRLDALFSVGDPTSGGPLDQAGLRDGLKIVEEYVSHGELEVAFEHLLYMVREPGLALSESERANIIRVSQFLKLPTPLG